MDLPLQDPLDLLRSPRLVGFFMSHVMAQRSHKSIFMVPTEGVRSNSSIPNDLSGALSGTFVLPDHSPPAKRMRLNGGSSSSHQSKRAPHLLQADAAATVKRMRLAETLPLSVFLPSVVNAPSCPVTMAVRKERSPPGVAQG